MSEWPIADMKLSEMREILSSRGIQLTRSLGQNFMHDGNQIRRIVEAAELTRADPVLEIGPGLGPLTDRLLERAGCVLAIEKDRRLYEYLVKSHPSVPHLELLHADALDYVRRERRDWSDWKMVSNLPYSTASPILVELALSGTGPKRIVATVQFEVARRITAGPGDGHYGLLTLLLGLHYETARPFRIPAGSFFPAPDVDSACVTLQRRSVSLVEDRRKPFLLNLIKTAFAQRRKMLVNRLKTLVPIKTAVIALEAVGLHGKIRPEDVSLDQYVRLARELEDRLGPVAHP